MKLEIKLNSNKTNLITSAKWNYRSGLGSGYQGIGRKLKPKLTIDFLRNFTGCQILVHMNRIIICQLHSAQGKYKIIDIDIIAFNDKEMEIERLIFLTFLATSWEN